MLRYTNAMEFNGIGIDLYKKKKYEYAIYNYTQALSLDPGLAVIYINRAKAYFRSEQFDSAIKDCSQAIALDSTLFEAYDLRGVAFYRNSLFYHSSDERIKLQIAAVNDFSTAIWLKPDYIDPYYMRGLVNFKLNRYDSAIADFTMGLCLYPQDIRILCDRALVYCKQGRIAEAISDFSHVLALDSSYAKANDNLNRLLNLNTQESILAEIKTRPVKEQITILNQCLIKDTVLGVFFRQTERSWRVKSDHYQNPYVKDICDHLRKIDPDFVMPVTTPRESVTAVGIFQVNGMEPEKGDERKHHRHHHRRI